ncbi:hypothetical protein ACH5RR_018295 [Cinchona calisaya]|uniref:Uncharacterized protein n=1 Tax=Cinchona calisaya TaxID=153742 RepID=A0ABD2ZL11_9GENT
MTNSSRTKSMGTALQDEAITNLFTNQVDGKVLPRRGKLFKNHDNINNHDDKEKPYQNGGMTNSSRIIVTLRTMMMKKSSTRMEHDGLFKDHGDIKDHDDKEKLY